MPGAATKIRVHVQREDGRPLPDARLMLDSKDVELPDIAALSDDRGEVLLGAFKNAEYQITCAAEGYETTSRTVTLGDEDEFDVVISLVR